MLHFLQQDLAFPQQGVLLQEQGHIGLLHVTHIGHVIDGQEHPRFGLVGADELLGVHHQATGGDAGPHEVGFIVAHLRSVQEGVLEQVLQLGNVPLPLAEFGKRAPVDLVGPDIEGGAERGRGADHAQIIVEQQQREMRHVEQSPLEARRWFGSVCDVGQYAKSCATAGSQGESPPTWT